MHWASILGAILVFIGALLSLYGSWKSDGQSQKVLTEKIDEKNSKIESLSDSNTELTELNKSLINQNTELISNGQIIQKGNQELLNNNVELISKIDNYQSEIEIKNKKIEELESIAKSASKGYSSSIRFDGNYIDKTGGNHLILIDTEESKAFKKILEIQKTKNLNELLIYCEKLIKTYSTWLTPYFFKAYCFYNLDKDEDALAILEFVEKECAGDLTYLVELIKIYDSVGLKKKADEIIKKIPKEQRYKFGL